MFKMLFAKMKDSVFSLYPLTIIVIILSLTPLFDLTSKEVLTFIVSAILMVLGMGLFNLGADMAMRPMGEMVGVGLTKTKKALILVFVCFVMGVLITTAEPDLTVLSEQVKSAINPPILLIVTVGVGVGFFLVLAILKIIFKKNLASMLLFFYLVLFALSALLFVLGKQDFIALAFDSGGVTTGPITVPFIMSLGVGIALTIGGRDANENSFGLISLCSIGPILAVIILALTSKGDLVYTFDASSYNITDDIFGLVLTKALSVFIALGLIFVFFIILQFTILKLPRKKLLRLLVGILYSYFGLVIFLSACEVGFLPIGYKIGTVLANLSSDNLFLVIIISTIFGMATVLGEPAVYVLNKQVEEVTNGTVTRVSMTIALSIGVGISVCLSVIRIIFNFSILYYLVPGYLLSLGLSFFVPKIYTSIAFDSGGVASGPLASCFILPFAIGMASTLNSDSILSLGFGIVAMVAMTPLITIQVLGFRAVISKTIRDRITMKRILDNDDEQIIYFD